MQAGRRKKKINCKFIKGGIYDITGNGETVEISLETDSVNFDSEGEVLVNRDNLFVYKIDGSNK